jgi:hypothetical protein
MGEKMNIEERTVFVTDVLLNLQSNKLSALQFGAVRELMVVLKNFKDNGGEVEGEIDFPEFDRHISYNISDKKYKKSYVKMVKNTKDHTSKW